MRMLLAGTAVILMATSLGASPLGDGKLTFAKSDGTKTEFRTALNACYAATAKSCYWTGLQAQSNAAWMCMDPGKLQSCMETAGYARDDHGAFRADFVLVRSGEKVYVWKP